MSQQIKVQQARKMLGRQYISWTDTICHSWSAMSSRGVGQFWPSKELQWLWRVQRPASGQRGSKSWVDRLREELFVLAAPWKSPKCVEIGDRLLLIEVMEKPNLWIKEVCERRLHRSEVKWKERTSRNGPSTQQFIMGAQHQSEPRLYDQSGRCSEHDRKFPCPDSEPKEGAQFGWSFITRRTRSRVEAVKRSSCGIRPLSVG
ncbi:hypothetical protein RRG08_005626 [Elysia crispata]|uniref:Uncharacterized protein n=1 Tax=Elysia crispata TaxID=231223 RepID=A0AAE1D6C7_9GAST|nr:hypothetical protein RRG08_005626 [Elysia crispata]